MLQQERSGQHDSPLYSSFGNLGSSSLLLLGFAAAVSLRAHLDLWVQQKMRLVTDRKFQVRT
jgi:hypothetical protein